MTYDYYKGTQIAVIGILDQPNTWSWFEFETLKVPRYDFGLKARKYLGQTNEDWLQTLLLSAQHDYEVKMAALERFERTEDYTYLKIYNLSIKYLGEKITEEEYNKIMNKDEISKK